MAVLTVKKQWVENIWRVELDTRWAGGEDGTANIQAKQLAARTEYLKDFADEVMAARETESSLLNRIKKTGVEPMNIMSKFSFSEDTPIVASTENVNVTTGGLISVDGINLTVGDLVFLKDQTNKKENGFWEVHAINKELYIAILQYNKFVLSQIFKTIQLYLTMDFIDFYERVKSLASGNESPPMSRRSSWYFIQQNSGNLLLPNDLDRAIIKKLLSCIAGMAVFAGNRFAPGSLQFFFCRFDKGLPINYYLSIFRRLSSKKRQILGKKKLFMEKYEFTPRIRQLRDFLSLNQTDFSRKLGIPRTSLINYEKGGAIPSSFLDKLKTKFDVNIEWFLYGNGEPFLEKSIKNTHKTEEGYKIPLLNQKVSSGTGVDWLDEPNVKGFIDFLSWIPHNKIGRLLAFPVQGNSMVGAGIKNGDYVLFDAGLDQNIEDDIYVFSLDGEVFCKQLEFDKISKRIKIYSLRVTDLDKAELLKTLDGNDADLSNRFHVFGRVFCWIHPNPSNE